MGDLISKEAVMDVINRHKCDTSEIILGVLDLPTVEAEPVVHGEWKFDRNKNRIYCSQCKNLALLEWNERAYEVSESNSTYCPNCGAKMGCKCED